MILTHTPWGYILQTLVQIKYQVLYDWFYMKNRIEECKSYNTKIIEQEDLM